MRTTSQVRSRALAVGALCCALVLGAACGSSDESSPGKTAASTTTTTPLPVGAAFAQPGPYPVGVTTLRTAKGVDVEVWYPAAESAEGTDTYNVRDFLPESIQAIVPEDVDATYATPSARDAAGAQGSFPLVLFSHGSTGFRKQSTFLTYHLASWGFVVASPDHASRSLLSFLSGKTSMDPNAARGDLEGALGAVERASNPSSGSPLEGLVVTDKVVAVGHSAGGWTALQIAQNPKVLGLVSMASGNSFGRPGAETTTIPVPDKPSLWLAGGNDQIAAPANTEAAFRSAPAPTFLWEIAQAGHNAFDDFCTMGEGKGGLVGLADSVGIGNLVPDQLRALATDGCLPPNRPVEEVWPAIEHSVVAFARFVTGQDRAPVALDADAAADIDGVQVRVETRLDEGGSEG